jgi:hypothetical protein
VSIAVSFIPVVGPLISCIVDGTFVDMLTAISSGDWAMLGMCCMAFIPGAKVMKGLKAVGGIGKSSRVIGSFKVVSKTAGKEGKQAHHLIPQRFAETLGVKSGDMPAVALTKAEHQPFTNAWRDAIPYKNGLGPLTTKTATRADITEACRDIYKNDPDLLRASLDYLALLP